MFRKQNRAAPGMILMGRDVFEVVSEEVGKCGGLEVVPKEVGKCGGLEVVPEEP